MARPLPRCIGNPQHILEDLVYFHPHVYAYIAIQEIDYLKSCNLGYDRSLEDSYWSLWRSMTENSRQYAHNWVQSCHGIERERWIASPLRTQQRRRT